MDQNKQNDLTPEIPESSEEEILEQAVEEIAETEETVDEVLDEGLAESAELEQAAEEVVSEVEAVVEAETEVTTEAVEGVVPAEEPAIPVPAVPDIPVKESKFKKAVRTGFRWLMGLLIVFGIGFLTAVFTLYQPARRSIDGHQLALTEANNQTAGFEAGISELNNEIAGLEGYAKELEDTIAGLEGDKLDLFTQLDQKDIRVQLLKTRLDIAASTLALKKDDFGESLDRLESVGEQLASLEMVIDETKVDDVKSMQQRLELIISELVGDPVSAESDMAILAANLVQLENDLFGDN